MATMTRAQMELSRRDIESLPHLKKGRTEFHSACPFCLAGRDRFVFFLDKCSYWCRQCGVKGFVTDGPTAGWDRDAFLAEVAKRAEAERTERKAALDIMATRLDRMAMYHHQMTDRSYWYRQGLSDATIDAYQLGWSPRCPTYQQSPSWTIPVRFRSKLLNIRHRLIKPPAPGDKYRPEMGGVGNAIFNADLFDQADRNPTVLVVEGEIKSMALTQRGFPAIGVPGASSFKESWGRWFAPFTEVLVVFDPGAAAQARRAAAMIGDKAKVATLPVKPDDFFVVRGGTVKEFGAFLAKAL
jgi:DNA primase